jgi:hypothetical protein
MPELRTVKSLLRWLSAGILALVLLLSAFSLVWADTGTYRIPNYAVTLEPQSDGRVKITYDQTWQVLSGNIPWITVGLPNSKFNILDFSGAAAKVSANNSGSFQGVRIDLDKTYLAGQTFTLKFSVLQSNLLERLTSDKSWRINFTPGWYDQAVIDKMQVTLISPVDTSTYFSIAPPPLSSQNNTIIWQRSAMSPGDRFNIIFQSTDGSFLSAAAATETPKSQGPFSTAFFVVIGIVVAVGALIALAIYKSRQNREAELQKRVAAYEKEMAENKNKKVEIEEGFKEYVDKKNIQADDQGRYYDRGYGSYITPAIWAATILYQQQQRNNAASVPPSSRPHTPSCACVSCACACACACAGGGAAGCAKKSLHECAVCKPRPKSGSELSKPA